MSDFCKQCSIKIFGEDNQDLKGLGDGKELSKDCGWQALCEGCGPIVVNDEGECIANWCNDHKENKSIIIG